MSPVLRSRVCHPWSFRGFLRYHVSIFLSISILLATWPPFSEREIGGVNHLLCLLPEEIRHVLPWPHSPPDLDVAQLDHLLHLNLMLQALQQVEVYSSSTNSCRSSLPSLPGRVCQKKYLRSPCHPCQVGCFKRKKYLRSGCSPCPPCQASTPTTPSTMLTAAFSFVEDPPLVG